MPDITTPLISTPLDEGGQISLTFYDWMESVTNAINNLQPITGSGSPESVVKADKGRWYVDVSAAANEGIYFKQTGFGGTGWIKKS